MKIKIENGIPDSLALEFVLKVVQGGKISKDSKGREYYCFITIFEYKGEEYIVQARQGLKEDTFEVIKKN
jgi:hypothetical protein